MNRKVCSICAAELSPWEGSRCVWHGLKRRDFEALSAGDVAVAALEQQQGPLSVYDITRVVERDYARELYRPSLAVTISSDWRFCWAGKGLYGLYRHHLVPGPRNLQGIGSLFLYAAPKPITLAALAFAMSWCGYVFADFSLLSALRGHAPVVARLEGLDSTDARSWSLTAQTEAQLKNHVRAQRFAPNDHALDAVIDRCRTFIVEAEAERQRRLGHEVEGSDDGPHEVINLSKNYAPSGALTRENYEATLAAARAGGRPWRDGSRKPIAHILRRGGTTWTTNDERDAVIERAREVIFGGDEQSRDGGVVRNGE